jgi:thiol reductant ABC exporter CydD subunit
VLAGRGVDALDAYFSKYLPQLVLAVVVPLLVLGRIVLLDPLSFVTIALTLPLIPVFMALVGMATAARTQKQWATLETLAGHFLDVVAGLPTLKVFGRAKAQAKTIRQVTDRYRVATMKALRLSFLSALVLELLATISVALVAVGIGLRLVNGHLDLRTGLLVLILAPEAYLPLRQLGLNYHASAEGLAAAERVVEVLELPVPERGTRSDIPDLRRAEVVVEGLRVRYDGRDSDAVRDLSLRLRPGRVVAVAGPSGAGKSTVVSVLMAFVTPDAGSVSVLVPGDAPVALAELDPSAWRGQVAYLPQRPALFAASLADNVRLARPGATEDEVRAALLAAGAADVLDELPDGLASVLGEGGSGLSTGQRRRVGLARVLLRGSPLVVLDEPTAGLDAATETVVAAAIRDLADRGAIVLVVSHRPAVLAAADEVVEVQAPDPVDEPTDETVEASAEAVEPVEPVAEIAALVRGAS